MKYDNNTIPVLSYDVIARNDKNGILLFQVYSDEMYFVSFAAHEQIISKCDGSKTMKEIIGSINLPEPTKLQHIHTFFKELEKRQIITIW